MTSSPPPASPPTNPYVGPRPFETGEHLYGRDREVLDLCDLLLYKRFVLLHSPSGAGKSSLIQAGLVPLLAKKGLKVTQPLIRVAKELPAEFLQAANRYILSTAIGLEAAFPETQRTPLSELAKLTLSEYLDVRKDKLASAAPSPTPAREVLVFDQFEEMVSLNPHDREAKQQFFSQLGQVLAAYQYMALFAMREDYVASLEEYLVPLPERLGVRFRIDLLGLAAAMQSIQGPPAAQNVTFTDDGAQALAQDLCQVNIQQPDGSVQPIAGQFIEPVQLQVVCRQLWEARADPNAITLADLQKLRAASAEKSATGSGAGSPSFVDQVLGDYYAAEVARVAKSAGLSERTIRNWFDTQLITAQGLRGQVLRAPGSSQGLANEAIQALLDVYLVRKEERRGLTWIELSHDRLVRPIQANNRQWSAANLQPFQQKAAVWAAQGKLPELLLTGRALEEARAWTGDVTADEREFIQKSLESTQAADRARQTERGLNLADVGWGVIFAADAPPTLKEALDELLQHRRKQATERRTQYYHDLSGGKGYQRGETARKFLARHGAGSGPANPEKLPFYLLIVGDADMIPFDFQYELDERYAVGRICFDTLEEYASYARSVVQTETGNFSLPKNLTVFAPQHPGDTTIQLSNEKMTRPVLEQLQQAHTDWQAQLLTEAQASKAALSSALGGPDTPALLFTVAHGMTFNRDDARQRLQQGAILTQDWPGREAWQGPIPETFYYSAADVPADASLLGLMAFMWGESTAGTPDRSEFASLQGATVADRPFVARLPQCLLGHPRGGALAVIGHVDMIWSTSFLGERQLPDFGAIADTIDRLMRGHTVGSAVEALNQRYSNFRSLLSEELIRRQLENQTGQSNTGLSDRALADMLTRTFDARNYIILGDPAARLPLDSGPVAPTRPAIEPVAAFSAEPPPVVGPTTEPQPAAAQLVFNGVNALTGEYLVTLAPDDLAERILAETPDSELLRELRWSLS